MPHCSRIEATDSQAIDDPDRFLTGDRVQDRNELLRMAQGGLFVDVADHQRQNEALREPARVDLRGLSVSHCGCHHGLAWCLLSKARPSSVTELKATANLRGSNHSRHAMRAWQGRDRMCRSG
jgi:hypothetical protein